jgi:hypothetical protein
METGIATPVLPAAWCSSLRVTSCSRPRAAGFGGVTVAEARDG